MSYTCTDCRSHGQFDEDLCRHLGQHCIPHRSVQQGEEKGTLSTYLFAVLEKRIGETCCPRFINGHSYG